MRLAATAGYAHRKVHEAAASRPVGMAALRHALALRSKGWKAIPLEQCHPVEVVGKRAGCKQTGHACANDDGVASVALDLSAA